MSAPWTRENDATIARLAEGLEVVTGLDGLPYVRYWYGDEICDKVPDTYLTDLTAVMRAAEAWCAKNSDGCYRSMSIDYEPWHLRDRYTVELSDENPGGIATRYAGAGNTLSAALAHALLQALGGGR